jgi:hypothetical protein
VRDAVQAEFREQQRAVVVLERGLMSIEERRSELVAAAIREAVSALYEVAYQLPDAIERIFQPEVKEMNVHIVRNRGSYQELLARIGVSVVKRQEQTAEQYKERKARWRTLRHTHTVEVHSHSHALLLIVLPQLALSLLHMRRCASCASFPSFLPFLPLLSFDNVFNYALSTALGEIFGVLRCTRRWCRRMNSSSPRGAGTS